jgi:hypothetical protein
VQFRRSVEDSILSRSKRIQKLLDEIVWIDGLSQIAWWVVDRKFFDALRDVGVGLEVHLQVVPDEEDELGGKALCQMCHLREDSPRAKIGPKVRYKPGIRVE